MKNITKKEKPQQIRENSVKVTGSNPQKPLAHLNPTPPIPEDVIKVCPRAVLENVPPSYLAVYNTIIASNKRYSIFWASHEKIGLWSRYKEKGQWRHVKARTVLEALKFFRRMGLVSWYSRKTAYKTNIYKVSNYIFGADFVKNVGDLLPALKTLPIIICTLLNNNFIIKNKYKSESPQRSEVVMNQKDQVDVIQGITSMQLSTHGKVQLLAFHQSALEHAERECLKAKNVRDAFKFFCSLAIKYSTEHGLPVDYKRVTEMKFKYGLQGTEQSVITSNIPFDEEAQPRFKQPPVPAQIKQPTPSMGRSTGYLQQADQVAAQLRERRERTRAQAIAMGIGISEMTMGDIERAIKAASS